MISPNFQMSRSPRKSEPRAGRMTLRVAGDNGTETVWELAGERRSETHIRKRRIDWLYTSRKKNVDEENWSGK